MFSAVTKSGGTCFVILVMAVGRGGAVFVLYGSVRSDPVPRVNLRIVFFKFDTPPCTPLPLVSTSAWCSLSGGEEITGFH